MWETVLMIPAVVILGFLALFLNDLRTTRYARDPQGRRYLLGAVLACLASLWCLVYVGYRMNQVNHAPVSDHR